jgi:hypothetical protein
MTRYFVLCVIVARCIYILFQISVVSVDNEIFQDNFYCSLNVFGVDELPSKLAGCYTMSEHITYLIHNLVSTVVDAVIPTVHAESFSPNEIDWSFNPIVSDTTPGGILINNYIAHIHNQNMPGVKLFITNHGLNHSKLLINMLNELYSVYTPCYTHISKFTGDRVLLDFLQTHYNPTYNFNIHNSSVLKPIMAYDLPVSRRLLKIDGMNSGVYAFSSKISDDMYIGSALSFRSRLSSHMASFSGLEEPTLLHKWANKNGGINVLNWSPIVDMPNMMLQWSKEHPTLVLSKGGYNTLTAFAQFPTRIMEQSMYSYYSPTLHQGNGIITFFNVKLNPVDFTKPVDFKSIYQAVDLDRSTVLAQESSMNKLANVIGLTEISVRNNINWHLPTKFLVDDVKTDGYLQELGVPIRTIPISSQLKPKQKWPTLQLIGRSLYDLIPGKIHVVDAKTLEDVYTFDSEKDLWLSLNPSRSSEYYQLETRQQYKYLGSRVTIYINVLRDEGNKTEAGTFQFCRHPDYLTKFKILATPFFAVSLATGLCTWYENNQRVPNVSSSTVLRSRNKNKVTQSGLRFINADVFVKHFPEAVNGPGSTFKLSAQDLQQLPLNPPHKVRNN